MSWLLRMPESLRVTAYYAGGEAAWPAEDAISAVQCATKLGLAVCGVEVWLPTAPGPTIPTPYIYSWQGEEQKSEEAWGEFVQRVNDAAVEYIREFSRDPQDQTHQDAEPYYNLDVVSENPE
jgi:hypothetical protein